MAQDDRGAFIWYELMTDDIDAARRFYGDVVGWSIAAEGQPIPTGTTYRMITRSDGGNAGGLLELTDAMKARGAKPGWVGYIHHPNVDAALATITAAGGTIHMPPMDMPDVGRMAMVADGQGAAFYVMTPSPPADQPDARSDVFDIEKAQHFRWNELWTTDQKAAVALYCELFGWTQDGAMPMGEMGDYFFIHNNGVGIGAVGKAQPGGEGSRWQYFAGVDNIDRAAEAVTATGGKLLGEPQQIPGGEYSVYAHDPAGATIGLVGPR
ncbi:VOC family protein [Qipengyuania sp.]|uniref:VOC family protein n=1 Tax=Qipengyuania sp. TaxID=2004515 RepID=UPI0035C83AF9